MNEKLSPSFTELLRLLRNNPRLWSSDEEKFTKDTKVTVRELDILEWHEKKIRESRLDILEEINNRADDYMEGDAFCCNEALYDVTELIKEKLNKLKNA